jgi:hypothetical protein
MLEGWRVQQLARSLATSTAGKPATAVRAFTRHDDAFPWDWTAQMLDEWLGELRGIRGLARSTIRAYGLDVSLFCRYVTDPVGLDYSIWPGQACGLRSSLGDLLGGLPARSPSARLSDGAGPA